MHCCSGCGEKKWHSLLQFCEDPVGAQIRWRINTTRLVGLVYPFHTANQVLVE